MNPNMRYITPNAHQGQIKKTSNKSDTLKSVEALQCISVTSESGNSLNLWWNLMAKWDKLNKCAAAQNPRRTAHLQWLCWCSTPFSVPLEIAPQTLHRHRHTQTQGSYTPRLNTWWFIPLTQLTCDGGFEDGVAGEEPLSWALPYLHVLLNYLSVNQTGSSHPHHTFASAF